MKDRDYSKIEVALYQLEKAIELFIEGNDYISCITLAGASEEITGRMVQRSGNMSFLDLVREYYKDHPNIDTSKKFYNLARQTRNALKHFNDEDETIVYVSRLEAMQYVQAAVVNYMSTQFIYTRKIEEFIEHCRNDEV